MKRYSCLLIFILFLLLIMPLWAADKPPQVGAALPALVLPASTDSQDQGYLGISGKPFGVAQVKAPVVVLQVLSMYCPYCQKEAPSVNALFKMIESDKNLKGKIKIIGIGAGNSAYETNLFRKKYSVPFPVLPDPDFVVYGENRRRSPDAVFYRSEKCFRQGAYCDLFGARQFRGARGLYSETRSGCRSQIGGSI